LYADVSYQEIHLTVGAKEQCGSMLDKNLSQGDFTYSGNARPIPEVNIHLPHFTTVPFTKAVLEFKANFAVGKSFDNDYILRTKNPNSMYATGLLWHRKSLFFKLEDPNEKIPLSFIFGLDHAAQWGGWTSHGDFGKIPDSFKDFIRIVLAKSGDENAILGDQINVLGNHGGTINVKFGYKAKDFQAFAYKQHFYDDNSGLEYANWRDGIWGGEISFLNQSFLKKVVLEYLQTTNQSGPMHFLEYDLPGFHPRGGGNDDYYNHDFYASGWSYFGRSLGNPLLTSPEYNDDGALYFKNNRLKSIHLGMEGNVSSELSYRTLFTGMQAWGRMRFPFLERKNNFSTLIECSYKPENLNGWMVGIQLAFDKGNLYGDNFGCSLKVSRYGVIGR
jgi:hypothetical protein